MPQDLSGFDAVLKIDYEKTIQEQINQKTPILDMFTKQNALEMDATGKYVQYPIHLRRNSGAMSRGEDTNLPVAGKQTYVETIIYPKYTYGRIQLTGQVIRQSLSSKGAFTRAMKAEMDGLVKDVSNYRNRALWGFGKGILAQINGDPSTGTTFTLDNAGGVTNTSNGNRYINIGDNVAVVQVAGSHYAIRGDEIYNVTAISADGTQITVSSAIDTAVLTNEWLVKGYGVLASGAVQADLDCPGALGSSDINNIVPMGLLGLVDDSTYVTTLQGVSRSTYDQWKSYVLSTAGALSLDMIQRAIDVVDILGSGDIDYFATGHDTRRAYLALLEANRRYMGQDLRSPDGGTVAAKLRDITYGTIPMKICKHAPYGTLVGCDKKYMTRWVWSDGHWDDTDGAVLHRVSNKDAFEAFYKIYDNFSNDRCNAHFRIDGITTTVVVVHNY